jgi:hypothetical protein
MMLMVLLFCLWLLPMVASFAGARLRWKVLCQLFGLASLIVWFFYPSVELSAGLWIAAWACAIISLRYTHADARTDRTIEALSPRVGVVPAAPATFEPGLSNRMTRWVASLGLILGLAAAAGILAFLVIKA